MWMCRRTVAKSAVAILLIGCLCGCADVVQRQADQAVDDWFLGDFARAEELLKPAAARTDGDFVLNNDRLGSSALAAGDLDTAEKAFLRSYEVINSVGVNDGGRSLGAAVVSENIKVWKGEPFERAMLNFDLGLVYYIRRDYENARGAFENALFKLRDYGEEDHSTDAYRQVESDFTLAYLMLGRCYQRLDRPDAAQKDFARLASLRPDLAALADVERNRQANVLLVIDFGRGPRKVANRDGTFVGFRPLPQWSGPIPLPSVSVDGAQVDLHGGNLPPLDLLALAQDRRWESIDTIRAIKSFVGTGLIAGGIGDAMLRNRPDPAVTLGLVAGGLLLKASSHADLRQWEMLPRTVFLLPLHLPPGRHDVTVLFPCFAGSSPRWHDLEAPASGDAAYYARVQRFGPEPLYLPVGE